jgi:hypothetical protein
MPNRMSEALPRTRWLAMQFTIVMTAPTERSSPPSSTGTVCAMATSASVNTSLAFCTRTGVEKPLGWAS